MKVYAITKTDIDVPFWVDREVFYSRFDQDDFNDVRDVKIVKNAYLASWFDNLRSNKIGFYIPVVGVVDQRTDLIGTRHRLAVLLRFLEELPIAFAIAPHLTAESKAFLQSIPKRHLDVSKPFRIPNLPIRDSLP